MYKYEKEEFAEFQSAREIWFWWCLGSKTNLRWSMMGIWYGRECCEPGVPQSWAAQTRGWRAALLLQCLQTSIKIQHFSFMRPQRPEILIWDEFLCDILPGLDDSRTGALLLWRQAETLEVVQPGEENVLGTPDSTFQCLKGATTELERDFL